MPVGFGWFGRRLVGWKGGGGLTVYSRPRLALSLWLDRLGRTSHLLCRVSLYSCGSHEDVSWYAPLIPASAACLMVSGVMFGCRYNDMSSLTSSPPNAFWIRALYARQASTVVIGGTRLGLSLSERHKFLSDGLLSDGTQQRRLTLQTQCPHRLDVSWERRDPASHRRGRVRACLRPVGA